MIWSELGLSASDRIMCDVLCVGRWIMACVRLFGYA